MDGLEFSAFQLWSVLAGAAALLFYAFLTWPYRTFKKQGLKGPKPLPLIGTMLSSFTRSVADLDMENAEIYGKVYGVFNGRTPLLIISDPDMVKEILIKHFNCFVNRGLPRGFMRKPLDRMLGLITDDHWRHVRSSLAPAYSSGKLKQMMPTITECVKHLEEYLDKHLTQPVAIKDIVGGYAMDVIAGTAFGLNTNSLEQPGNPFMKNASEFLSFTTTRTPKKMIAILAASVSKTLGDALSKVGIGVIDRGPAEYLEGVVKNSLNGNTSGGNKDRKDFLHLCLEEMVDMKNVSSDAVKTTDDGVLWTPKGLTEDDIISNSVVFLLAGYDTVSTFLSFFCYAMATNPDVQQKAYEEIAQHVEHGGVTYDKLKDLDYLEMCMDETLRMYPPIARLPRKCNKTTTVGGVTITAGMLIEVSVYAMHHDADYWEDPFNFNPERFTREAKAKLHPCVYLPFGTGPRNCIGMRLALMEAKAAIVNMLSKYEICTCRETVKPPLKFEPALSRISPAEPIKVAFRKRRVTS